jgi:hypothetical protein
MKQQIYEWLVETIKDLDWSVYEDGKGLEMGKYSPAGQDFTFYLSTEGSFGDFCCDMIHYIDGYDPSYEASLWIGPDGHGRNGAPYDMKDLYEDMEACEANMRELYDALLKAWEDRGIDDDEDLPTDLYVWRSNLEMEEDDDLEEVISDYLSDTYGFCHNGFQFLELDEDKILVTDIQWDIDEEEED